MKASQSLISETTLSFDSNLWLAEGKKLALQYTIQYSTSLNASSLLISEWKRNMKLNCLWTSHQIRPTLWLWFWRAPWISLMDGSVWHQPIWFRKKRVSPKKRKYFFPQRDESQHVFERAKSKKCWRMLDHLRQFTKLEGFQHLQKWVFSSKWQISKTTMIQIQNSFSTYTIYIIYKK